MTKDNQNGSEHHLNAFHKMMERLHELGQKTETRLDSAQQKLAQIKDKAVEFDQVSREEADKIYHYLRRDIENARQYLSDTGNDWSDWLHMDLELIEHKLMDMFTSVADQTTLDLLLLEEQAQRLDHYHSGEIVTAGTLECEGCGELLRFQKAGRIPPCPRCHNTQFKRKSKS